MNRSLLSIRHLTMRFDGLEAVKDFSLEMERGDLLGLIGPNGAGKTTVFNVVSGYLKPTSGMIFFQDREITGWRASSVNAAGIARTFQNIRLFQDLKVIENVTISGHGRMRSSFLDAVFHTPRYQREEKVMEAQALELLRLVHLEGLAQERAGALAYGQQRRLEIVRALATQPKLLLLDEPAAGMNPQEAQELMNLILRIKEDYGLTIILIEHQMKVVMGTCHWIKVLDYGAQIAEGRPREIQNNPAVIAAYLGEAEEENGTS